jgi:RNA polymerase sigma factor (sigma-70 family)
MRKSDKGVVFQDLDRLFRHGTVASGDGALLESFLAKGDESAFEALVNRHGPMVRGVCRRLLPSPHDADDAFQATFLVLVRKGRRLRDPDRLGPWLHGVATREALKARASRRNSQEIVDVPAREETGAEWCDVMPIIDAELARLPAKHRDVLVTCLIDGASSEEASRRLACPVGTVKSRLARAREALRMRLTSRGVAPAAALAVLTADSFAFASPVPSALTRATLETVTTKAVASGVAELFKGVAPIMFSKASLIVMVLFGVGSLAGLGATAWINPSPAQGSDPQENARPKFGSAIAAPRDEEAQRVQERNLKEIARAATDYHSAHNVYPTAAIYGTDNQPLLSWRVALLPYLHENELYQQFHLNEPWDSPHNRALASRMPAVFETPAAPAPSGQTRIRGFVGKGAVFDPTLTAVEVKAVVGADKAAGPDDARPREYPRGVTIAEIPDGTAGTVLAAVARDATPWTKPGDLPFVPGQQVLSSVLDDSNPRGYVLFMCNGAIHLLKKNYADSQVFQAMITRAGGEIYPLDVFADVAVPLTRWPDAQALPAPGQLNVVRLPLDSSAAPSTKPAPFPTVEQRLQSLEEKVDRILQKLDAR